MLFSIYDSVNQNKKNVIKLFLASSDVYVRLYICFLFYICLYEVIEQKYFYESIQYSYLCVRRLKNFNFLMN